MAKLAYMPETKSKATGPQLRKPRSWCLVIFVALMSACSPPSTELPPAPPVELQGLLPASAEALGAAVKQQQQMPEDAQRNGHLAMLLQVHGRPGAASAYYARARALDDLSLRWAYLHGLCLEELGEPEAAVQAFGQAVALNPDYVPAVLKLSGLLLASGDTEASGVLLGQLVELYPGRADVQFNRGRWLLKTGQAGDAIAPLTKALAINGSFAEGHYLLASAYSETGSSERALEQQQLFEQHRKSQLTVDDPERQALQALNTTDRPDLLKAEQLMLEGQNSEAIVYLSRALDINPSRITTYTNLVMLYGRKGDYLSAGNYYRAGVEIDPDDSRLYFQYGNLKLAQRAFAEAALLFERSMTLDPAFADAAAQLGTTRQAMGDNAGAAEAFRKALEADPNHRQANFVYGKYLAVNEQAYPKAIEHLKRALLPEDSTTASVMYAMAGIYAVQNRFGDAVITLKEARIIGQRHGAPPALVARINDGITRFTQLQKQRGG
jgi:tetratricopeptide (TPR) repeat protein